MTTTTTTPTTSVIKLTKNPVLAGDVFYGNIELTIKDKSHNVIVSNHMKEDKKYEFRLATKCQAGFISISDYTDTPKGVITSWKKGALVNIQVKNEYGTWSNVYTVKTGKWHSIDKSFLDVLTVGDMRQSFPDMCDDNLWKKLGAKTWADKAFVQN
jgi:hypothetical protein